MEGVSGVGSRVQLSRDDDESTKSIVERDTKVSIAGSDANWRALKTEHQTHVGPIDGAHIAFVGAEAAEVSEFASFGMGGAILGPILGFGFGIYELYEAHEKADAQNAALIKDNAHVALLANLDLPESYKSSRLNGDFKHVDKGTRTTSFAMTEKLKSDAKGCSILQLHADRGMNAARDCMRSGMTRESFFAASPKAAEAYAKDAAFKEGFDAYVHTQTFAGTAEKARVEAALNARDAWATQQHLTIRV